MSVPDGPDAADAGADASDPGMYLAGLLTDAVNARSTRGAQWLHENAIDPKTGERVFSSRQVAWTLLNKPKRAFLEPDQFRALVSLFGWEPEYLRDVCLHTIGITMPKRSGTSQRATMLPAGLDDLPEGRWRPHRDLIFAAVEDNARLAAYEAGAGKTD